MSKSAYRVVYEEVEDNTRSKNYGFLVRKTKRFSTLEDAVQFYRVMANTNMNVIGSPIIEEL